MTEVKLTKKQLKAAQFRGKGNEGAAVAPVVDAQDDKGGKAAEEEKKQPEEAPLSTSKEEKIEKEEKKRKRKEENAKEKKEKTSKAEEKGEVKAGKVSSKKRKLEEAAPEVVAVVQKRTKKRFTEDGEVVEEEQIEVPNKTSTEGAAATTEEMAKDDKRYIVFVGNMSFKSTSAEIAKHFSSHCNETPTVRLLTKKGDPSKLAALPKSKQKSIAKGKAADPSAPVSKGCAFVEFKTPAALQKALQYHHTSFEGRNINVELTAGGGGKGSGRKEKIKKKNEDLEVERQKLHEKYVKNAPKKENKEGGGDATKKEEEKEKATAATPPTPQWGPRASASASKQRGTTKIPKWAASGSNAVRLSG